MDLGIGLDSPKRGPSGIRTDTDRQTDAEKRVRKRVFAFSLLSGLNYYPPLLLLRSFFITINTKADSPQYASVSVAVAFG